jgi:hypothetical protein
VIAGKEWSSATAAAMAGGGRSALRGTRLTSFIGGVEDGGDR